MPKQTQLTSKRRCGALLSLELAVALPMLLLVVVGAVEFSFLLLGSQAITAAANVGARQAALPSSSAQDVNDAVFQALASWRWARPQYLQVLIFADTDNGAGQLDLVYDSQDSDPYDNDDDDEVLNAPTGTDIQVTVKLPSNQAAPDLLKVFGLGLNNEQLTATFITRKE